MGGVSDVLSHSRSSWNGQNGTHCCFAHFPLLTCLGAKYTAVHLIKLLTLLYAEHKLPILACAYTNVATDNLLQGLLQQGVSAVRVGRPVKVRPELREATLDSKVESHPRSPELGQLRQQIADLGQKLRQSTTQTLAIEQELSALRSRLKAAERSVVGDVLKSAPVICCTCIGAGDDLLRDVYFPFVVIDGTGCCLRAFQSYLDVQSVLKRLNHQCSSRSRTLALSRSS